MKWLPGPETLFVVGLVVVAPALLAKYIVGASWLQVACAYFCWIVVLCILLGGHGVSKDETIGWTLIMTMFFGWLGVPISALVIRVLDLPYRFLG
jgi:hypothetical protein